MRFTMSDINKFLKCFNILSQVIKTFYLDFLSMLESTIDQRFQGTRKNWFLNFYFRTKKKVINNFYISLLAS